MVSYSYPIAMPTSGIQAVRPVNRAMVAARRSPFSAAGDVQVYDGQVMGFEVTVVPTDDIEAAGEWEAFFLRLNGRQGTFLFGDPTRTAPQGGYDSGSDTPLVDSSASPTPNQEGQRVLVTDGWRVSQSDLLKPGDALQLGAGATASLHKVLSAVDSDGSGIAEIDIWPRLPRTLNDTEAVTLASPQGVFKLAESEMPWEIALGPEWGFSFICESWW